MGTDPADRRSPPVLGGGALALQQPIGRGAAATVWRAEVRGEPVAVKILDGEGGLLFRRELHAVARLDHPAIAMLLDHGAVSPEEAEQSGGQLRAGAPYIVTELAGGTLSPQCGALGWPELRDALLALLSGLGHAHARGVLHRDLKPSNVLTDGSRSPYLLADFGLASLPDRLDEDDPAASWGTPTYMAPEQCEARGRDQGPWTDLYALGCVAFALATGRPPYGSGWSALHGHLYRPVPALSVPDRLPAELDGWVGRLLRKAPADRFQRAVDAARALCAIDGSPGPAPPNAWRPAALPRVPGAGPRLFGLREGPLVGRDRACEEAQQLLADTERTRTPALLLVEGPAGCGKSRLARWLTTSAHEYAGAEILSATHAAQAGPRDGLGPMIGHHLGSLGLPPEALREHIAGRLGLAPDEPLCASLAHWCAPDPQHPGARHTPIGAVVTLVLQIAAHRTAVVALDDLQWADDAIVLAERLLDGEGPALVIATVQTEALAEGAPERATAIERLRAHPRARTLRLGALPQADQIALVRSLVELDPALLAAVGERTAGNPLFAVQLVGDWLQRGWLVPGPGGLALAYDGTPPLPDSLSAGWRSRIERLAEELPEGDERALELAALLGQRIVLGEWTAACAAAGVAPSEGLLERLALAGLATADDEGFVLVHNMLREAIVERAEAGGRGSALHLACADALAPSRNEAPARIGRHLLAAGELRRALDPLYEGAHLAAIRRQRFETDALLDARRDALLALGVRDDDPLWIEQSIVVVLRAEDPEAVQVAIQRGLALAPAARPVRRARIMQLAGDLAERDGDLQRAIDWYDRARAAIVDEPGTDWMHNNITASLLHVRIQQGEPPGPIAQELRALLDSPHGDRSFVQMHLIQVAWLYSPPDLAEITRRATAALEEFRREGRPDGRIICLLHLGDAARFAGDLETAEAHYREALRCDPQGEEMDAVTINLAILDEIGGRHDEARATIEAISDRCTSGRSSFVHIFHALMLLWTEGEAFDRHWQEVARVNAHDPDIAWLARRAARRLAHDPERAARAEALAELHDPGGLTRRADAP